MASSPDRDRILIAVLIGMVAAFAILARLVIVQVVGHERYHARAEQNQEGRALLTPRRGDLMDRKGRLLATDLRTYSVYAVPRLMKDPRATASQLARILDLDANQLQRSFRKRPSYCWVSRQVDPGIEDRLQEARLRGVFLKIETRREYPEGEPGLAVIGRVNRDGRGVEGIEYQLDRALRGRTGWETIYKDGSGRPVHLPRGSRRDPVDGESFVLSLDAEIQGLVVSRLESAVDRLGARGATAVVLDPHTGEILAMASAGPQSREVQRNQALSDTYEPGSTFKLVAAAAILEEKLAKPETVYDAEDGAYDFGGFTIHDAHEYGEITLADAVRYSSNIVAGKLGLELGDRKFYEYATSFGFGSLTGIEFPGEVGGRLRPPHHWSGRSLPTLAIGQEVATTPLQMALSYAVLANGGHLMKPLLVVARVDAEGQITKRYKPRAVRRVVSKRTAETMRWMMQAVVDSGTATRAHLEWAGVAGKTGTAQKYDPERGTYSDSKYVSSFVGMIPADRPRLVCLVLVDEPRRGYYGGEVAAPVFRDIMEDIRRMRSGPLSPTPDRVVLADPDWNPPSKIVPDVRLLPVEAARERLAGLGLRVRTEGDGARVVEQVPPAGAPLEKGEVVELVLHRKGDPIMPRVTGRTVREAVAELSSRGIAMRISGSGLVREQAPPAGARVEHGGYAVLYARPGSESWVASVRDRRRVE